MAFLAGKNGRVKINGTPMRVRSWSIDPSKNVVNVGSTEGLGWTEKILGMSDLKGTLEAVYDPLKDPFKTPFNVFQDDSIAIVLLPKILATGDPDDLTGWRIPLAVVTGVSMKLDVNGEVAYTINFENNGPAYPPGAVIPAGMPGSPTAPTPPPA